jgi:uncharacterized protein (TIGR00725 family)
VSAVGRARPPAQGEGTWLAVVGSSTPAVGVASLAEAVGAVAARAGATLVCGGLGGVMEAACRGAKGVGGLTVGILPGSRRSAANPWVDVAIPTGLGELRNALVVRSADAVISVGGGFGTLSEVALALREGVPVIGISTWRLVRGDGSEEQAISRAEGPEEAVSEAIEAARSTSRHGPRREDSP